MARWNTPNVICWTCGSHERHRALWLLLNSQHPELLAQTRSLLHFAPEPGIGGHLRALLGRRYVTADLVEGRADLVLDLNRLALEDASYDAIVCSHVLEHIPDDRRAMSEMRRVLRPGGWALIAVPINTEAPTLEDPSVTAPEDRRRVFWQEDHVRLYGMDIADRLGEAGFEVSVERPADAISERDRERYRLGLGPIFFLASRPA